VKPIDEGGSYGIRRTRSCAARRRSSGASPGCTATAVTTRSPSATVDGREITVGLLGNRRPHCLPLWEIHFDGIADGTPRIATERIKWSVRQRRACGVHSGPARACRAASSSAIVRLALRAWRVLRLSGFARIDFRVDAAGTPWLIDVNANPMSTSARTSRARPHTRGSRRPRCSSAFSTWVCATARTG
jgi:D-alanine-D-alanine ligase